MGAEQPSGMTAVDAQFGRVHVLRPFAGFEAAYQGQSADIPIAFPGGVAREANQDGFDDSLAAALKVAVGQRLLFWFPVALTADGELEQVYTYRFVWRYRGPEAIRRQTPFHYAKDTGQPDTSAGGGARAPIPAAYWSVGFEQLQDGFNNGQLVLVPEGITVSSAALNRQQPLLPGGGSAVVQQGIFDPNVQTFAGAPSYVPLYIDAEGDELIILANRNDRTSPAATWDFTAAASDLPFSNVYGTGNQSHPQQPEAGIYVVGGTNP